MDDNRLPSQAVHTLFPLFVCVYLSLVSIFAFLLCPSNPTTGCHKPNKRAAIVVIDICDSSIYQLQLIYKLINLISCDINDISGSKRKPGIPRKNWIDTI